MNKTRFSSREPLLGQTRSRVLLPLALVLLVLLVGIVADAVLLLERYTVLTGALNNAAISAAREIRAGGEAARADALDVARELVEIQGLDVVSMTLETCSTSAGLCADEVNRKQVRVVADVAVNTVLLRFFGADVVQMSAAATAEIATLDLVILIDVSESMLDTTTPEIWAQVGLGQVYVPPKWGDIVGDIAGDIAAQSSSDIAAADAIGAMAAPPLALWGEWLRADPQTVTARLSYEGTDTPYAVSSFPHPNASGEQRHPRRDCRVQFYPYSVATDVDFSLQRLGEFSRLWGEEADQWQGFMPAYDYFGCCNDPTRGGRLDAEGRIVPFEGVETVDFDAGDFDFSDLICEPFRQSRAIVRHIIEHMDFEGGDRVAFVTFDRRAFVVDPDGANGGTLTLCEAEAETLDTESGRTTLSPLMTCRERALDTLERHIGVRAEPSFYTWNEDGGGWTGFVRGENDYPVRGNCPFQNAALPNFFSLYSLWDWGEIASAKGLDPLTYYPLSDRSGLYRIMNPDVMTDDVLAGAWGPEMSAAQSYELWASCGGSNLGAALREGYRLLTRTADTGEGRENTVQAMVVISDGGAGVTDAVRFDGRKPVAADPYALLPEPAIYPPDGGDAIIRYGVAGEYGAFGLCPMGMPDAPTRLTRTDVNSFPFCMDLVPETRHFCPASRRGAGGGAGSGAGGGTGSGTSGVGAVCAGQDVSSAGFSPFSPDRDYDCELSFEENISAGHVYDVDLGDSGTNCDPLYDVDDYVRDWADFVTQGGAFNVKRPFIYAIGVGVDFANGASGPGLASNPTIPDPNNPRYTPGSVARNPQDYLGEELLRYLADAGDNLRIDTDYQQDWLDNFVLDGSTDYGPRGPCEDPDAPPGTIAPLPPHTDCGAYFNNPSAETLRDGLFAELNSRRSIELVTRSARSSAAVSSLGDNSP